MKFNSIREQANVGWLVSGKMVDSQQGSKGRLFILNLEGFKFVNIGMHFYVFLLGKIVPTKTYLDLIKGGYQVGISK